MVLCALLTSNIWLKWNQNPVIVTFDDKPTPIANIPFPAITLCPIQKFGPDKISTVLGDTLRKMSEIDISGMGDIFFRKLSSEE